MKITFVYPDILPYLPFWKGYYYCGIGSLSSFLKLHGHQTSLIHITQHISKEAFIKAVVNENPGLIGFSSTSHAFPIVKRLATWLKEENIPLPVICGGIHPSISPDEAVNTEGIDMICRGEGEEPLLELCNKLERGEDVRNIPNIWVKEDDIIHKNPLRPPCEDLNTLPYPDRSIYKYEELFHERLGEASVMVSRGCPYQCSYCCNHALRGLYDHKIKHVKFRSVDNAIGELKQILKEFPFIKAIHFDDDILFLDKKWGTEFMLKYRREVGLPFRCNMRPDLVDEYKVGLMKEAGCFQVVIGLESGNDYIRNEILNRRLSNDQIINAFHVLKKAKLQTKSFNMVGIPCEDVKSILDTIKLNAEVRTDEMQVTIFQPYQGTKLHDLCVQKGYLTQEELAEDFFSPSPLMLDTVTHEQVLMFRHYFKIYTRMYQMLYLLPKVLSGALVNVMDRVLSLNYIPKILNKIFPAINSVYRLIQYKTR